MILKYGTYAHDDGEVTLVITKEKTYAQTGQQTGYKQMWSIKGVLQGATVAALTTAINALDVAYTTNGYNLILYESNGTTQTSHAMISNDTASGVRITKLSYPVGDGAEYTTFRNYEIEAESETVQQNVEFESWQETISMRGGGPRFIFLQTLTGQPQKQLVAQSTPYFATQSGSATGFLKYPRFPPQLWPQHEHIDQRELSQVSPQTAPNTPTHYQINWSYEFESATPMFGVPGSP